MKLRYLYYALPVLVLLALLALFTRGLFLNPKLVPSPLIGKQAPAFSLPRLREPQRQLTLDDFKGRVVLLNVWGTWCVACRDEHETLMQLAKRDVVPIYGFDYNDQRPAALDWLKREGDPYTAVGFDPDGSATINWGVYGAPETFLLDRHGVIRHKYIGPLTPDLVEHDLLPRVRALEQEGA
ncbi:MAG TPA: DsbE family thiol:disulfide interchange protein [Gammaproteobacteria bacterium]|nr:DsbE family thiol:disulfide interchange protein [Gammaproteobacteria bacterium]